jgi:hypothetical protein
MIFIILFDHFQYIIKMHYEKLTKICFILVLKKIPGVFPVI